MVIFDKKMCSPHSSFSKKREPRKEEESELGEKRRKFLAPFASCKIFYGKTCGTEIQLPHTFGVIKEENFLS